LGVHSFHPSTGTDREHGCDRDQTKVAQENDLGRAVKSGDELEDWNQEDEGKQAEDKARNSAPAYL
jgi:hypothetical protein